MNWAAIFAGIGIFGSGAIGAMISGVFGNRSSKRELGFTKSAKQIEFDNAALESNRSELKALTDRVSQLETSRNAAEASLDETRADLRETRTELGVVSEKLADAERRLASTQRELHTAQLALSAAERKAERLLTALRGSGVPVPDGI